VVPSRAEHRRCDTIAAALCMAHLGACEIERAVEEANQATQGSAEHNGRTEIQSGKHPRVSRRIGLSAGLWSELALCGRGGSRGGKAGLHFSGHVGHHADDALDEH
jgi:hypothetical protein